MDKKWFTLKIAFILIGLLSASVNAEEDKLPAYLSGQNTQLERCSLAELKAYRLFHVGYAALYKKNCQTMNIIFDNAEKRLRFVYDREIPARAFSEASEEYLKINLGTKFRAWRFMINQFNRAYQDIEEGDFYDLIYHPDAGLKLHLNGSHLATLDDPEIGQAYFTIWFGKDPFSEDLKKTLTASENL